jgi:hypothetical protein
MNISSKTGGFLAYGYIVARNGNYNLPIIPMAALLPVGVYLWLRVDPIQPKSRRRFAVGRRSSRGQSDTLHQP